MVQDLVFGILLGLDQLLLAGFKSCLCWSVAWYADSTDVERCSGTLVTVPPESGADFFVAVAAQLGLGCIPQRPVALRALRLADGR
ncbi:hypothetical protein JK364_49170 [Streptomyces sp. 110]|uniref:Secreted protein n=1 Tax=Streptomyces endocoffeicus TaxID=2898945 RepID=A0ABS1Q6D3_9ACTN|nr:hypothetical protein [Streptomyces endocoffeicus]MBL1120212.1 hypothetical protein [Streptomyces endocoffeicus]